MSEDKITVRMDRSSWSQIVRNLEKFYGMDVEETEVWESVEVQDTETESAVTQHKATFSACDSTTFIRCDCGWTANVPQDITAIGKLESAYAKHMHQEMTSHG